MNIEAILAAGYGGPNKAVMESFVVRGGENAVKTLDPTGQAPAGGRATDYTSNDVYAIDARSSHVIGTPAVVIAALSASFRVIALPSAPFP